MQKGDAMETLAFWMPGPWELAICAVLALGLLAAVGAAVVIAVVLARRSTSKQPPATPGEPPSVPPGEPPPSETSAS
jgi:hypothetical protein